MQDSLHAFVLFNQEYIYVFFFFHIYSLNPIVEVPESGMFGMTFQRQLDASFQRYIFST